MRGDWGGVYHFCGWVLKVLAWLMVWDLERKCFLKMDERALDGVFLRRGGAGVA